MSKAVKVERFNSRIGFSVTGVIGSVKRGEAEEASPRADGVVMRISGVLGQVDEVNKNGRI